MVFLAGTALASPPGAYPDRQEVLHEVDHPRTPEDRPVWREWRTTEPDGIAYSQFTASYRSFVQQQPLAMRQLHQPGDKLFLDFDLTLCSTRGGA